MALDGDCEQSLEAIGSYRAMWVDVEPLGAWGQVPQSCYVFLGASQFAESDLELCLVALGIKAALSCLCLVTGDTWDRK